MQLDRSISRSASGHQSCCNAGRSSSGRLRAWLVRAGHAGLCGCVLATLLVKRQSVLHVDLFLGRGLLPGVAYLALFVVAMCLYFVTSLIDPGYVSKEMLPNSTRTAPASDDEDDEGEEDDDDEEEEDGEDDEDSRSTSGMLKKKNGSLDVRAGGGKARRQIRQQAKKLHQPQIQLRFCRHCTMEQPLRSRHCEDCGRCVARFDHHCPWVENCVGERNHSLFLAFIVAQFVLNCWTVGLLWRSITPHAEAGSWLLNNWPYAISLAVALISGIPLLFLGLFHCYLACSNSTTWEQVSRERISYLKYLSDTYNPFHEGYCLNCFRFCCSRFPYRWDVVYAKARSDGSGSPEPDV